MDAKEIKAVFDRVFNGKPNPIFCYPVLYFEHNGYLCEVAEARKPSSLKWSDVKSPLDIFEGLLVDDGAWVTVLTKDGQRTMLGGHIETIAELEQFKQRIS